MSLLLFFIIGLFPLFSLAALDEVSIFTEDKTCGIRYLSSRAKYNWNIKVEQKACQNGWVDGFAKVQLYSPTKENVESLEGFFRQGYWLDSLLPIGAIVERKSSGAGVQSLSFLLGKDEEADITYVGQLRAVQPKGRSYGPFQGCPDFRVLVVVPDTSVFQREAFIDKIIQQGMEYARSYCVHSAVLALFGATSSVDPQIIFQMQVDLETGKRLVIPILSQKSPVQEDLFELRKEKGDVLLSVTSEQEKTIVSYQNKKLPSLAPIAPSKKEKDILGHLQILSHLSKTPIWGRTVVHIKEVLLDGTGVTDLPEEIHLLYYPGLKTGWAVIEGKLQKGKMQVSNVQFCQQEWCSDVP